MHELSIAMSIVDVASEEADRLAGAIVSVHLKLGPLSGVVKEALLSAYGLACEGTALAGSRLVIIETQLMAWCSMCNVERQIASVQHVCCPVCQTPTPDILSGRELEIVAIEISDEPIVCESPTPRKPIPAVGTNC
jgi:hydrogenase nickel incorporation protein HypA/HybF